jgi:hypothetical protein
MKSRTLHIKTVFLIALLAVMSRFAIAEETRSVIDAISATTLGGYVDTSFAAADFGKPRILSIELSGGDVIVHVQVPNGVRKITLESRSRLSAGAWIPRIVQRVDAAGEITIRLPKSESLEVLRIRGDAQEPLPARFYEGKTNFTGQATAYDPSGTSGLKYAIEDTAVPGASTGNSTTTRTVVESDIWAIRGSTLYFFNQYRGLQIVDLTQPDAPVIRGRLDMPATGEQMYVLDDSHVVLLVRNTSSNKSQAVIVDVAGDPKVVGRVDVDGDIQESRMVGTALYIASQAYRQITVPGKPGFAANTTVEWQWGSVVTSFDLSSPEAPAKRDTFWYVGYGNVITATDKYLLVSYQAGDYWTSNIEIIDISSANGAMRQLGKLQPAGRVADKFKMNISKGPEGADVLAVISEFWNGWQTPTAQRRSVVQTFSLADPASPTKLGYLEVGHGESLYATRFDGDRVYIVTFLRIDPLWIVDLKDPAQPKLLGELQVPGWSTYMCPLGDRLVTIGIDNSNSWKVAVSLFDVKDPAKPSLLSKVPLGEQSSWSEANSDEKAFTVLPDAGLIMVPYQGWSSNDWASRVQIIDLSQDSLKARGVIEHSMQPRRATLFQDRIISISGRELLVVDAQNRDQPATTASLELSWGANRVFVAGDYLLEIEDASYWGPSSNPAIRIVSKTNPDSIKTRLELTNSLPVLGGCVRENRLYLLQGRSGYYWYGNGDKDASQPQVTNLFLTVFDLSALPSIKLAGQAEVVGSELGYNTGMTPVWPKPGLLVWSASGGRWGGPIYMDAMVTRFMPIWGGYGGARLIAFDVTDAAAPKFASDFSLNSTNGWWSYSSSIAADGLVYASHQASEFVPDVLLPNQPLPQPVVTKKDDGTFETNTPPTGVWVSKYYLDVVDYADPLNPTPRKPVNLPASLVGVSQKGSLLFTKGPQWNEKWQTDWTDYLNVCAYDGVQVSLLDAVQISTNAWSASQPLMLADATLLVPVNETVGNVTTGVVKAWKVDANGKLSNVFNRKMGDTLSNIRVWDNLLGAQMNQTVDLYNISNTTDWALVGSGQTTGYYYWPDLTNADGNLTSGLFIPLGDYGILAIPVKSQP